MATMTDDQVREFLTATAPAHTAKLATTRADGRPHVAPIWYLMDDDGSIVFTTGEGTVKGKTLRRDPRVALCVDDERPPFAFVVVEGEAEISEDLSSMLDYATRIGGRYMGAENAETYGRRNAVKGELLVRVRPTRTVAEQGLAD